METFRALIIIIDRIHYRLDEIERSNRRRRRTTRRSAPTRIDGGYDGYETRRKGTKKRKRAVVVWHDVLYIWKSDRKTTLHSLSLSLSRARSIRPVFIGTRRGVDGKGTAPSGKSRATASYMCTYEIARASPARFSRSPKTCRINRLTCEPTATAPYERSGASIV